MSDTEFFQDQQPAGPRISESGLSYYRQLLDDQKWCEANPAQAAMLRASVDQATALTGQSVEPPADTRSLAQKAHDRLFGVSFTPEGTVKLPDVLASAVARDAAGNAPDPNTVAAQLKAVGLQPEKVLKDAQTALDKTGSRVQVEKLTAHTLAALSAYAEHLRKHAQTRPKS